MQASQQTTARENMRRAAQRLTAPFARVWHRIFARGDFTALVLAVAIMVLPALVMQRAGWAVGLEQLVPVAVFSVTLGFLLSRSYYGELLSLLMTAAYSLGFIGLITVFNMAEGSLTERFAALTARAGEWLAALQSGGMGQDNLIFIVFVSVLFWFLGHNAAWHVFRVDRVWRVVLPPGLVILVNVFYYTGDQPLEPYVAVYAVLALLLIARSTIDEQEWEWYRKQIHFPARLREQFLLWGAVLAMVLVGVAWGLPNGAESQNLERIQEFLNSDPLDDLNRLFNRLFASLESEGLATADYYGGNSLQLSGAIQLGDQPVMLVQAPPLFDRGTRYYWRSRTFSYYESGRWTPTAELRLTVPEPGFVVEELPTLPGARELIDQRVTMVIAASRLVYAAPQPAVVDLPAAVDLTYVDERQRMDVSVIRPLQVLRTGDEYTVSSSVVVADAQALRSAGTEYPQWVLAEYLQLGGSVTQRTIDLTLQIVTDAGAVTPYDQAKAIENWLRANITYDETIAGPSPGVDPVDWVLFEERRGYCNYYASAMVMMLRSVGVPARLAAGFSQGEWDAASQGFLVRERDAHTWVEVYFPGIGWVEFEPTAAQEPLERPDLTNAPPDALAQATPAFVTNTPPPTPTFTPSPTFTPTPIPTSTPNADGESAPFIPPTVTMIPTTTSTPMILPTVAEPMVEQTQPRDIVSTLLSGLLTVLLVVVVIVALVLFVLFIVWWIEWRGLGGLSPVQRAYALLGRYARYVGITLPESYTPHERRRVLTDRVPRGERPVRVITEMYVDETYGPQQVDRSRRWAVRARNALRDVRAAFLRVRLWMFIPKRWRR